MKNREILLRTPCSYQEFLITTRGAARVVPQRAMQAMAAIPCSDPDPVTCHWPHWLPVNPNDPGSNWHLAAYYNSGGTALRDGTYEAVGPHFQSNPYALNYDFLEKHGKRIVKDAPRDFEGLREYLGTHNFEGLVFWKDGEPRCKIKRSDFGFKWPDKTLRVEF